MTTMLDVMMDFFDKEIENQLEVLRDIRTRRNEHAPISRLPPEILSRIFVICTSNWDHSSDQLRRQPHRYLWVKVTHVCRRWRTVALDCTSLWSYIPLNIPGSWISEMLVRSRELSLSVDASREGTRDYDFNTVFGHLHRLRSFKASNLIWQSSPTLLEKRKMPCLEELSVFFPSRHYTVSYPQLRGLKVPLLRTLSLENCLVPGNSSVLKSHNLAQLTINPTGRYFKYTQFLDIVQHTPQLQHLAFSQNLDGTSIMDLPSHQRVVKLPQLAALHIKSGGDFCAAVLNQLAFPKSASIQTISPTVQALLPIIAAQCNFSLGGTAIRALYAQSTRTPNGHPATRVATQPVHPGGPGGNETNFGICVMWTTSDEHSPIGCTPAFIELLRSLDLSLLTELHVHGLESLHKHDWLEVGRLLSKVTTIKMSTTTLALVAALGERTAVFDRGAHNLQYRPRFCPRLRRLSLEGVDFEEQLEQDRWFSEVLHDNLSRRKGFGTQVEVLDITNCHMVSEDDIRLFEGSVGNVTWDGVDVSLEDRGSDAESSDHDGGRSVDG
ncbi:hypothetical protein JAAARDRAFT_210836 [Jaapia argillacea MUCL 33604]|uniref:F-box domain-containing protein n=1 Tax=Jaapia argillacea MUCL 33604 TaxID=933084 RepID=A0A067PNG3_9AGAM|nr:hypothetical protein JAAARDRAFT_210836 [Jaapia argillacea MUCL 33604]